MFETFRFPSSFLIARSSLLSLLKFQLFLPGAIEGRKSVFWARPRSFWLKTACSMCLKRLPRLSRVILLFLLYFLIRTSAPIFYRSHPPDFPAFMSVFHHSESLSVFWSDIYPLYLFSPFAIDCTQFQPQYRTGEASISLGALEIRECALQVNSINEQWLLDTGFYRILFHRQASSIQTISSVVVIWHWIQAI